MSNAEEFVCISCVDEVRYSFVSHLSEALRRTGINDEVVDIPSDDLLSKESQAKIEKARVSVMVLPANCEPTKGVCRDNFLMVLECQRIVVPVLYGDDSPLFGVWHNALDYIGLSPIHHSRKECSDSKLVEEIVRDVYEKLFYMGRIGIYPKLLEIENMVNKQPIGIRCVGIWGMPGIGKTTLAKAVFDQMSGDFDAYCFIEDYDKSIHEKGLYRLLEEQLFKEKPGNGAPIMKRSSLRDRLNNMRVLVVLDDVRNALVAESFLEGFDWLRPESLIIITSRDKQVFNLCRINQIYEVQGLNEKEALQLFLLCASLEDMGEQNLHELSVKVINYANGNPLAISIYGRELKGKKKLSEMETAFLKLKRRPPFKIVDAFKSSYDTLSDNEKNIFLDIACFFQGENVDYVIQLLEGCGFFPHVGIDILVEKCLVTISENRVRLHNLTQDVGRDIINGETVQIERRRRLWEPWTIKYLLEYNEHKGNGEPKTTYKRAQGSEEIEGMFLDTSNLRFDVQPSAFKNMLNLRLLKIYCSNPEVHPLINFPKGFFCSLPNELRLLHWENYPLQSLPQSFYPRHLVEINMPYSQLQKLWSGTKNLEMLRTIRLCHSQHLIDIDDLLKAPNLEVIDLQGCTRLQNFPAAGHLLHLRVVNLSGCIEIKSILEIPPNIETLHLQGTGILALPLSTVKPNHRQLVNFLTEIPGLSEASKLEHLKSLLESSSSCQDLGKLICLALKDCSCLQSLPNMANLDLLKVLDLSGCSRLNSIQGFPRFLKELYLAGTAVREVPKIPQSLELLNAHGSCLRSLPNMANLEFLKVLDLSGCSELETIQGFPRNLKKLYCAGTPVREVPQLPLSLELLNVHGSASLKSTRLDSEKLPMHYSFSNLFDLSPQVVNDFLVKALTNVKHIPREFKQELNEAPTFSFSAPSHTNQNGTLALQAGSSVMTRLNPSWRNTLVGFGMLVEVAFPEDYCDATGFGISCVCRWSNKEGRSYRVERNLHCWAPGKGFPKVRRDHTFVFCDVNMRPSTGEGNNHDIWADLVVFEFFPINQLTKCLNDRITVTRCGVRVINVATGNTSLEEISPVLSLDPMEVSGYEVVDEVLRVNYDELQEMDKVLFLYIACLFNAEDVDLVAPLIAGTDLDVSSGLKVLADVSLISVSSNGEIVMHYLLRKMAKEILHGQSMLLSDSQSSMTDKPSSILEQLLSNPDCYYSDAEIIVDRVPVGVHRCILAARSKFFQELFKKEKKNSKTEKPKYQLKKMLPYGAVGHEAFLYFLSYIYTRRLKPFPLEVSSCVDLVCPHDSCRPAVDFVVQLMYASSILQVPELVSYFQRRLSNFVEQTIAENVLPILMVAFNCKLPQLLHQCIERVARSDLYRFCIEKEVPPEVAEKIKQIRLMSPQDEETSPKISEKLLEIIGKILKALDSDDVELVKLLLNESDITLDQANGLHYSVVYSDPKVVAEILALGMGDVNYRNSRGYTVLHFAAIRREPSIIISLIDKGANASEFTSDGLSAVNILRRLTNPKDYHTKTAKGRESSKARLCIDILEREIRKNPMVLDTPLPSLSMPEDLQMRLLYLEKRVGLAQLFFPTEAKVAMDIGNVEGTSEYTGLPPPSNGLTGNLSQVDLNETPHMQTQRLLSRMEALMKTVETLRRFFPYGSEVLDKYMAEYIDEDILNDKGTTQERRLKRMRYRELKDDVQKAYSKDKEAKIARSCLSASSSHSSSSIRDDHLKNTT